MGFSDSEQKPCLTKGEISGGTKILIYPLKGNRVEDEPGSKFQTYKELGSGSNFPTTE